MPWRSCTVYSTTSSTYVGIRCPGVTYSLLIKKRKVGRLNQHIGNADHVDHAVVDAYVQVKKVPVPVIVLNDLLLLLTTARGRRGRGNSRNGSDRNGNGPRPDQGTLVFLQIGVRAKVNKDQDLERHGLRQQFLNLLLTINVLMHRLRFNVVFTNHVHDRDRSSKAEDTKHRVTSVLHNLHNNSTIALSKHFSVKCVPLTLIRMFRKGNKFLTHVSNI